MEGRIKIRVKGDSYILHTYIHRWDEGKEWKSREIDRRKREKLLTKPTP